ncbi:heterokaryon incompatibility protein-domain-containing protein, partial [Microdochium bolleyi]
MRLLRVNTLEPVEFMPNAIPPYAILSHTWDIDEVSYQELVSTDKSWQSKAGWAKIRGCARKAAADGHGYIWVDTCCIDKKSSAELQEAINSMFQWYSRAQVCYAYLSDVSIASPFETSSFRQARWWSRGWTLQELLAPEQMVFFDRDWYEIGRKDQLLEEVEQISNIGRIILGHPGIIHCASIAERMSWMAGRSTTREEDLAYCLLGIFDIHMPMLYGEGHNAFSRLQQEIMKASDDMTLLAW